MQWPMIRSIYAIVSIGALSGIFVASSLALVACQKKPAERDTVMPSSNADTDKGKTPNDQEDDNGGGHAHWGDQGVGGENDECDVAGDPTKNYVGQSPGACATMKFACEAGKEYFADECGCGCMTPGMTDSGAVTPPMSNERNEPNEPNERNEPNATTR